MACALSYSGAKFSLHACKMLNVKIYVKGKMQNYIDVGSV